MPVNSLIIGVDLAPIKPVPRAITFQGDITTDKCRATIRQHLKTWKADTVLHDGAPNVGTAWVQDAFTQAELVLQAMKLATEFLIEGGMFVTKVFRSKDYNSLMWVFNQLFGKVEATKPPSSRAVSAEIFVVCRDFKAPKRIDPKFLDPKSVFAELADPIPNNEAKVFKPEIKKRKRDGYEEGDYTQYKEAPVSEFVQTTDPIAMLGSLNTLSFKPKPNCDIALAAIDKLPETTLEIRRCCADLKVLGRRDFRALLKWRLLVRERFGYAPKKAVQKTVVGDEVAEIAPLDEELQLQEDLQRLTEQETARRKKERRKENEKKQKEIMRMQLHMTAPMDIGLEQDGPNGEDALFALKAIDRAGVVNRVAKGKMGVIVEAHSINAEHGEVGDDGSESEPESFDADDELERELDTMYEQYQQHKAEADAKYRAKKARQERGDDEWEGFSDSEGTSSDEVLEGDESEDTSDDGEASEEQTKLMTDYESHVTQRTGLTRRAEMFFEQDIFRELNGLDKGENEDEEQVGETSGKSCLRGTSRLDNHPANGTKPARPQSSSQPQPNGTLPNANSTHTVQSSKSQQDEAEDDEDGDGQFEVVRDTIAEDGWEEQPEPRKNGRLDIDIITAEAMTLAQRVASGETTTYDLIDEGFNKYTFRDKDGLPEWFLDDENRHSKPNRPITAAAAAAIKEKLRALNARPIKKVREAKDRKRFKAAQRLEKLRKKSALLAEDGDMTEKDKAQSIANMMKRAAKKGPRKRVKLVVAKGGNRGISGRPRGVKGKYKIVDARLKKDVRAEKRLAKKRK